ncbi:sensor histidine kinase [Segetibacter aerophilus]|uniref:histidine kinase n=1 Tax=Segetibacter aerophilus TaxID=670293 RepID=A0A512BCJ2_9BACT|nr:histidine kinase N-terminal 7TM domain-containing protein [Segetibacter aerophilus]GEO09680.1 two-component sensor histidine kinase [Segetibacter aerophilus]
MHLSLNPYALILSVSGLATIILSIIIYTRLKSAERSFAFVIGLAGWWALTYAGELFSSNLSTIKFWLQLEYVGITLLPLALLLFIHVFIFKQKLVIRPFHAWIALIPVSTLVLVFTNDYHHYYYKSLSVNSSGAFPLLTIEPSFWYYVFTAYFYAALAWSIYSLATAFKTADRIYVKQKRIIFYALVIPWIFNILYKLGVRAEQNIDLTPFAFIATSTIISFGLLRYKLLDIIPEAREKIFESMQDGVLVLDSYNTVIDKNSQMECVLSHLPEKIIGAQLFTLFPLAHQLYQGVMERRKNTIEIEIEKNGSKNYYEVDINVLTDRTSDYSGCILIFNNITQRKKDAISLAALNEQKDRLFSIIAHDVRSPLINIMDMVRLIDEQVITETEFKTYLPELSKNLNYTSSLLDNLLHWSKSQLKGEVINPGNLDIRKIVKHEIAYYQQKATQKGIYLSSTIEDETGVFVDAEMIQLVIRNLIGNAIKYCSKEDYIIVSATVDAGQVTICVKDTGSGMKPEIVEKLFRFETFTIRGTNNERGTGLGLQLCKDFVEKNNGKIWVTTELNVGSKFYFTMPVANSKILIPASASSAH